MDIHVRRLGTVSIIFGAISLVMGLLLLAVYGGPLGLYYSFEDTILGFLVAGATIFHLVLAIPCIIGGVALRAFSDWSRSLMIVACALNTLNFPVGMHARGLRSMGTAGARDRPAVFRQACGAAAT
jgi:hypothetical protein